jgi:hypothetical protein
MRHECWNEIEMITLVRSGCTVLLLAAVWAGVSAPRELAVGPRIVGGCFASCSASGPIPCNGTCTGSRSGVSGVGSLANGFIPSIDLNNIVNNCVTTSGSPCQGSEDANFCANCVGPASVADDASTAGVADYAHPEE